MPHARPIQPSAEGNLQSEVVAFLSDPASYAAVERVERFETHGNFVFLAGGDAWKIKRAVRFPYMDFSTLEKRHAACVREVEINRRFGSDLYLGCVPIGRSQTGRLDFGHADDIVEWAVHMRRFDQSALLSVIAGRTGVSDELARALADIVHHVHRSAEPAALSSGVACFRELMTSIAARLCKSEITCPDLTRLTHALAERIETCAATLDARAEKAFVRRCHGDLHLSNIIVLQGQPALYDAIEFDEAVATIDTLYDLAFLLMDLDRHDQRPAANVVLNRYLWLSGMPLDFQGLIALPLFLSLRAAVRAMVTVDRSGYERDEVHERDLAQARAYLSMALEYLKQPSPQVVAIGGLSGTGKSTVAASLAPWLGAAPGAIHLRTDLERKGLAGVGEFERLPDGAYAPEAREHVYQALTEKARLILGAGHAVIIDGVFADQDAREDVQALAKEARVPFCGIWLHAHPETLLERVIGRRNDASDATAEVVRAQLQREPGSFTAEWRAVDAGGTPAATAAHIRVALKEFEDRSR
jgi:aminoglycoside phosphotransferase family enzyme/predicted kinase